MENKQSRNDAQASQPTLVTNKKKYTRSSILAFVICLLAALIIWIHAENTNRAEEEKRGEHLNDIVEAAGSGEN